MKCCALQYNVGHTASICICPKCVQFKEVSLCIFQDWEKPQFLSLYSKMDELKLIEQFLLFPLIASLLFSTVTGSVISGVKLILPFC